MARLLFVLFVGALSFGVAGCGSSGSKAASPRLTPEVETSGLGSCSTAVAREPALGRARIAMTTIGGDPFGVTTSLDGRSSFVSGFTFGSGARRRVGSQVTVLSDGGLGPRVVGRVDLGVRDAAGETVTDDGRYLLVASGSGAAVIDVARAEAGKPHAVLGYLTSPEPRSGRRASGAPVLSGSAIEVAVSPDDRFAFVSLEFQDEIAVFNLADALADGFRVSDYIGAIPLGVAVVGMAVSPSGRWLYATSEIAAGTPSGPAELSAEGTVSVIGLVRAETKPATSVLSTAPAGCGTVRVATSPDGRVIWVTARESDALLAFSAAMLVSDPKKALLARLRVGEAPVGLAVVDHGTRIVVADSNRFGAPGASSGLTVVDAAAALAGKPALVGVVKTGLFPREVALEPNGRVLLVTDFESGQLEAVDLDRLG